MDKQSYTIRVVIVKEELNVLKNALAAYQGDKSITEDLLSLIKHQEDKQNER